MQNWIIRVDLPERNVKKAVSIDKNATVAELKHILLAKMQDTKFLENARFYLPSAPGTSFNANNGNDNTNELSSFGITGSWILDDSVPVRSLFPEKSGTNTPQQQEQQQRVLQLREFQFKNIFPHSSHSSQHSVDSQQYFRSNDSSPQKRTSNSAPTSRRSSVSSPMPSSINGGCQASHCTFTTAIGSNNAGSRNAIVADHSHEHPLDDISIFQTLKKKHSLGKFGRMATKHFQKHIRSPHSSSSISPFNNNNNNNSNNNNNNGNGNSNNYQTETIRYDWFGGYKLEDIPKHPITGVPIIVEKLIDYIESNDLKTEGIFRLSGGASSVAKLKELFQRSNTCGIEIDLNRNSAQIDGHIAASLLKMFLRELPEPLLTNMLYPAWIAANETSCADLRLYWIYNLLRLLPHDHFLVLKRLCFFFKHLGLYGEHSKMSLQNFATILGPNILRTGQESPSQLVGNAAAVNTIALELVKNCEILFGHSDTMINLDLYCLARAMYSYSPSLSSDSAEANSNELSFEVGDLFFVRGSSDGNEELQGWWPVEVLGRNNEEILYGFVPSNYLEVIAYFPLHQQVPLDELELNDNNNNLNDMTFAERSIQTEDLVDYELQCQQLISENLQLREEIGRLKNNILLLEESLRKATTSQPKPLRPQSSPTFLEHYSCRLSSPFSSLSIQQRAEATCSPVPNTSARRPKRAPPPAPPVSTTAVTPTPKVENGDNSRLKRRSFVDRKSASETFEEQLSRALARQSMISSPTSTIATTLSSASSLSAAIQTPAPMPISSPSVIIPPPPPRDNVESPLTPPPLSPSLENSNNISKKRSSILDRVFQRTQVLDIVTDLPPPLSALSSERTASTITTPFTPSFPFNFPPPPPTDPPTSSSS